MVKKDIVSDLCEYFLGVTTIVGGKSNVAGYIDGPSEDAKFSNDFDVVYVWPTCSLLVIDRGNAALRQIALDQEDCDYQSNSISSTGLYSYLVDYSRYHLDSVNILVLFTRLLSFLCYFILSLGDSSPLGI